MKHDKRSKSLRIPAVSAAAALLVMGFVPATAAAATTVTAAESTTQNTSYRQLIGTASAPTYLEASVPTAGNYAIEYEVTTKSAAYFDTYVNGVRLGYVGGVTGTYRTRSIQLPAGGQLVRVTGPSGIGSAKVYIVSTS